MFGVLHDEGTNSPSIPTSKTTSSARRPDNNAPQSPSPPSLMSKSANISQSGTRRATGVSTLQGRPSHAATNRKALSDERFEGAAGASSPKGPNTSVPSQGSRTASILPSAKYSTTYPPPSAEPSVPSPPPLKRPSSSTSLLSSPTGPRDQAPSRGATVESPHSNADRGLVFPRADEEGRTSVASRRPPVTLEYTPSTIVSPRQDLEDSFAVPRSAPIHLERISTATERPSRQDHKDPAAAVPMTGYVPDIAQYQKAPKEGSTQRTDSSYRDQGYDLSASHLPFTSDARKKIGQPLNQAPPSDRREFPFIPPTALVSTQNQMHLNRDSSMSHSNSTTSNTNLWSPPPGDTREHLASDKSLSFPPT